MTATTDPPVMQHLALKDVEPLVGESFDLVAADHRMSMTLVEAKTLGDHVVRTEVREPFSMIFHAPREPVYPQNVYRLEHPAIGPHLLLTVPVGPAPDSPDVMRYEIIMG